MLILEGFGIFYLGIVQVNKKRLCNCAILNIYNKDHLEKF